MSRRPRAAGPSTLVLQPPDTTSMRRSRSVQNSYVSATSRSASMRHVCEHLRCSRLTRPDCRLYTNGQTRVGAGAANPLAVGRSSGTRSVGHNAAYSVPVFATTASPTRHIPYPNPRVRLDVTKRPCTPCGDCSSPQSRARRLTLSSHANASAELVAG